jgi:excisionase family DNA binding protein
MSMATTAKTASPRARRQPMLDVDELAEMLKCSTRHIYRMSESGRMPAPVRLGSLVRWDQSVIDEWIEDGCPVRVRADEVLSLARRSTRPAAQSEGREMVGVGEGAGGA